MSALKEAVAGLGLQETLEATALAVKRADRFLEATFYCAVALSDSNGQKQTTAAIVQASSGPDWEIVLADVLFESELPDQMDCPREILEKLSPPTSVNALLWRARCHARHALQEAKCPGSDDQSRCRSTT
ncbi:hypothetical protein KM176_22265 [Pseudooceanicola sp. CBS1P-1]|uniref:Uncharacterized protein n=1 Tax=Pseudooceanicola albus TaxID=2692189 RepID=A0A6L7GBK2_9RHOB|nr:MULTISPECIES: hypothetical protein [Pseudooceanicola]MBT9386600.1 hypothetical protein [Pseudooceanicola endophyticus]MXN20716.1 hypothetical protein [Pseudooceanicola albus]